MPEGEYLRNRDKRYAAKYDEINHVWKVLDTWHESLRGLTAADDIPDDSPALQIIPEAAFVELIREAEAVGYLSNLPGATVEDNSEEVEALTKELEEYKERLESALRHKVELENKLSDIKKEEVKKPQRSEEVDFRFHVVDAMTKLAGMGELSKQGK